MKKINIGYVLLFLFVIATLIVMYILPQQDSYNYHSGKLYINEVLSSNSFTIRDNNNEYSDAIEIYNGYNYDVNLEGFYLSDKEYETTLWQFPKIIIKAKSYLIVYASGKDKCDLEKGICHSNFKLSSKGEVLTLSDNSKSIISKITYEQTASDTSYGYNGRKYVYYYHPTIGSENGGKTSFSPITISDSLVPIVINEYMTSNEGFNYDGSGNYSSWIELYNYSDTDVNLKGFYLSDDDKSIGKYSFPNVTIKANSYLLIYTSGREENYEGTKELHTSFKLSNDDKVIILSTDEGKLIDKVEVVYLKDNVSYGRREDYWLYFPYATPNKENSTNGFTEMK